MTKPEDKMDPEQEYFEKRAEAELELAQSATHPGVVKAHYQLAGLYLDIVHGEAENPTSEDRDKEEPEGADSIED
ncbi:hypothetical protein ACSBM8_07060 [Sphingomonas sp. ASY06-1R]|jgi:hypothetical protein|uniref:hypothetical protein n=1 Tax=Sphingomonas sp. ASY06-1R TaxID=3445771 RepID=UPI003FA24E8D